MSTTTKQPSRVRHIRIPTALWQPAGEVAEELGQNPSEYVRDLIRQDLVKRGRL